MPGGSLLASTIILLSQFAAEADDDPAQALVGHEHVRTTTEEPRPHSGFAADPKHARKRLPVISTDPGVGESADAESRVLRHRLSEPDGRWESGEPGVRCLVR